MLHPLARVLEREPAALGQRRRHRVDAAGGGAREQAPGVVGDRDVDEARGVDVEHRALARLRDRDRAHHAEGGQVQALELEAGLADGADDALDHLAADRDDDDARARAVDGLDGAERLHVQHGLVDRHRDLVGGLHADGGEQRLLVLHHRHVERAHDDPLVGDAQAHAPGQVVLVEEGAQRLGERGRIGHVTVAQDAGPQVGDGAALERQRAVDVDLGGGHMAGVELKPDDRSVGCALSLEHGCCIGTRAHGLEVVKRRSGPTWGPLRYGLGWCSDYQLPPVGQPPLPPSSQVRVTTPPVLVMVNTVASFDFEVTATE